MSGTNAEYMDYMYSQWKVDPASVHPSWNAYFAGSDSGSANAFETPPSLGRTSTEMQIQQLIDLISQQGIQSGGATSADMHRVSEESTRLTMLLRAFMTHGHLVADIDPLNLKDVYKDSPSLAKKFRFPDEKLLRLLNPTAYGFTLEDLEREFYYTNPYEGAIL